MYCNKCGAELRKEARFCMKCGASVSYNGAGNESSEVGAAAANAAEESARTDANGSMDDRLSTEAQTSAVSNGQVAGSTKRGAGFIVAIVVAVLAAIALIALLAFMFLGNGGEKGGSDSGRTASTQSDEPVTISISQTDNADFPKVTLYAKITDRQGNTLESVSASDYTVSEFDSSGKEYVADIDEIVKLTTTDAMNINLVVDQSGSMSKSSKISKAKSAANAFIDSLTSRDNVEVELTSFGSYVYNRQPFTTNGTLLHSSVNSLQTTGDTALNDALYQAIQRTNLKSGSRVVIAFTDGAENASAYSEDDVIDLSRRTGIPVYIIGIGSDVSQSALKSLASSCNGQYFDAATADLDSALSKIYDSIYKEQLAMYRVVFTSAYEEDDTSYRKLTLSCAEGSGRTGTAQTKYMPVDNVSSYTSSVKSSDYILPDSSTRRYTKSELEELSLWELYLARNEIYARYGRGFDNKDLAEYFATRSWYTKRYTPDEFNALGTVINKIEEDNALTMLEIEKERNSPYIYAH